MKKLLILFIKSLDGFSWFFIAMWVFALGLMFCAEYPYGMISSDKESLEQEYLQSRAKAREEYLKRLDLEELEKRKQDYPMKKSGPPVVSI